MILFLNLLLTTAGVSAAEGSSILFIGNSYTFANGGLGLHLREFYASANPGLQIETGEITAGGATLENHWANPVVIGALSGGLWDIAVMQEQSTRPVTHPLLMYAYADSLGDLAASSGTTPAFLMTWARRSDPEMIGDLSSAYSYAAGLSGALVVPAGEAFRRSEIENPEILLYEADDSHPSPHGTYLVVCVLYAFLWGESPVGVEYVSDPAITPTERLALQWTAWRTWLAQSGDSDDPELTPR
jgi:hypothetical protein